MHNIQEADDLLDGIVDNVVSEPGTRTVKSNFEAWHLPRKQFVRIKQWVSLIERNQSRILNGKNTLSYLSLPGDDLLDLRVIHDRFCVQNDVTLKFLGFNKYPRDINDPRHYDINLSLVEVKERKFIAQESVVLNNDINQIGSPGSSAHIAAQEHGPFDVINLDFCDSIFSKQEKNLNPHELLREIIYLQSSRRSPWLMFITTRVGKQHIDKETLDKLMECFQENLRHPEFLQAAKEHLSIEDFTDVAKAINDHDSHIDLTLISLVKWLLSYCFSFQPKTKIELNSTLTYVVDNRSQGVDIVSFALLFTPLDERPNDKFSLMPPLSNAKNITEPEVAIKVIERVLKRKNCDDILKENKTIWEDMLIQTEELLSQSRYNMADYKTWLSRHFSTPA